MIKPGDKVRRIYGSTTDGPVVGEVYTVVSVASDGWLKLQGVLGEWNSQKFVLVENEPYIILAKDFDPTTQERQSFANGNDWMDSPLHVDDNKPIIVRDKVQPKPRFYVDTNLIVRDRANGSEIVSSFVKQEDAQAYADWRNANESN